MCGIVGYIGTKWAQDVLIEGLHRLEYRGYDSAGIVTLGASGATLLREKGKVDELDSLVSKNEKDDKTGIGHTRWATHGEPSQSNAHPHSAGDIYLVHNGIIENYKELRAELKNHKFASETDSEVLAALINSLYDESTSLETAVGQALKLVEGTYGIAVVSTREPGKIVVARKGSPLIVGVGENETIIASDASALLGHTSKAIYLNDGELAVCTADNVELTNMSKQKLSPKVEKIEASMAAIQKQGYDHFLLKEIMEQPETVQSTLKGRVHPRGNKAHLGGLNMSEKQLRGIDHVLIVACGTAYHAGLLAAYYIEKLNDKVTVQVEIASEFRYRSFHLQPSSVALVVSQSGETADTLACLREIKSRGIRTLGVVNAVGSTIAREVDGGVYVHAGPEISVASTKAFTSQVAAMVVFGIQLAQARSTDNPEIPKYIKELWQLPSEIQNVLDTMPEQIEKIAKKYAKYEHSFYLGRDVMFPTALEGALKLKEVSYIHTEGQAAGELKHGSLALVDDRFFEVMLVRDDELLDKSLSNLAEVNARGGHVLVITNSDRKIDADDVLYVPTKLKRLTPLVINVVQQLLAYYISVARGTDVDQPRNLAKSVTVE